MKMMTGKYNLSYYENMLVQYSKTAEDICKIRWKFIEECRPKRVLDYGSGVGWFRAFRPPNVEVDTFDIAEYPQTGITQKEYDVVCFWDVLEHIPRFFDIKEFLDMTKYVAITIPILPEGKEVETWKHFKPDEHLHYFSREVLVAIFHYYGFMIMKENNGECPPREDVWSFLFVRE